MNMNTTRELTPFTANDIANLELGYFKQLSWLVNIVTTDLSWEWHEEFINKQPAFPWEDGYVVKLKGSDFTSLTGYNENQAWQTLNPVLGDLEIRGYIKNASIGPHITSPHDPVICLGERGKFNDEGFYKLKDILANEYDRRSGEGKGGLLDSGSLRFDAKNNIVHSGEKDEVWLIRNRRSEGRDSLTLELVKILFTEGQNIDEWITQDHEKLAGFQDHEKEEREDIYQAGAKMNREIKIIFGIENYLELDHKNNRVKRNI